MTYFLQILKSRRGKFFLTALLFLIFLFIYYSFISIRNHLELKHLYKYPVSYFLSDELYGGEILITYDDGKYVTTKALTNDGKPKTQLKISPDGQKLGYFLDLNYFIDKKKNKEINFIDYDNYTALMIMNKDGSDKKEIYRGDYHLGNWEWISPEEVVIYQGCGTECIGFWRIDIETGEKNSANLGVNYQWSPDKKYVLAYHYTFYGITVGDKFGNEFFGLHREKDKIFPKLAEKTKGAWSLDSKKLALIIKKENQEKLELLVFNVTNNFNIIYQKDLESNNFSDLSWQDNQTISYQIDDRAEKIVIKD